MSVTPIQLISTIVCFLGTPLSPPHADVIWVSPLSCPWFMHAEKGCNKPTTQGQCRVSVSQLCERTILKVKRRLWQGQDDATLKVNRGSNKDLSCVWSTGPCLVWLSRPMPDSAWGNVRPPFIPSYKGGHTGWHIRLVKPPVDIDLKVAFQYVVLILKRNSQVNVNKRFSPTWSISCTLYYSFLCLWRSISLL